MMRLTCNRCKKRYIAKRPNSWYCEDCRRIRNNMASLRSQRRRIRRENNMRMICGVDIDRFINEL